MGFVTQSVTGCIPTRSVGTITTGSLAAQSVGAITNRLAADHLRRRIEHPALRAGFM